jgi:glycerol-3-phosphate acyltransferase PlsY
MLLTSVSIILAYLLGSVSSGSVIGLLFGSVDLRKERDGRISAAALYTRAGTLPFLLTVVMDIGLAALAVSVARILTGSENTMMLAGLAAVCGHNWSVWLKFKGGLGAAAIAGVLITIAPLEFFYALLAAGVVFVFHPSPRVEHYCRHCSYIGYSNCF